MKLGEPVLSLIVLPFPFCRDRPGPGHCRQDRRSARRQRGTAAATYSNRFGISINLGLLLSARVECKNNLVVGQLIAPNISVDASMVTRKKASSAGRLDPARCWLKTR